VRYWVLLSAVSILSAVLVAAGDSPGTAVRGPLRQAPGHPPVIETADHRRIVVAGDDATLRVLNDPRLQDSDFEVLGHFAAPERFEANRIHIPSLFLYRGGKRLQVSYWCDVCYIRTSSPGKCWCCQKPTDLDPIAPEP
jgi:hypothetical protein